ncbi:uncharacterized protein LOC120421776 [Culex pipiens pallens]|uniref:uncharacterized protein LOC120421776 n=1 Tax=Culex pipiens pallens TaxID=42434 RepID=UPI0022AAED77|nr:uncharacterized protein LOC120421776 [Culex pipiens pallens]
MPPRTFQVDLFTLTSRLSAAGTNRFTEPNNNFELVGGRTNDVPRTQTSRVCEIGHSKGHHPPESRYCKVVCAIDCARRSVAAPLGRRNKFYLCALKIMVARPADRPPRTSASDLSQNLECAQIDPLPKQ